MTIPRYISTIEGAKYYDLGRGMLSNDDVPVGVSYYVDKIMVGGELCLRTKSDSNYKNYRCVLYADMSE